MADLSMTFETLQDKAGSEHQIRVERAATPREAGSTEPPAWEMRQAFHLESDERLVADGSGRWRTERSGLHLFGRIPVRLG